METLHWKRGSVRALEAVRLLLGVSLVICFGAMLCVGCGQEGSSSSSSTEVAQADSGVPDDISQDDLQVAASQYSPEYSDIYENLSPEQRAQLAPGLTQDQLAGLTPLQLAALSLANQGGGEQASEVVENEHVNEVSSALGQLNMEEVSEAFAVSESIEDFEDKLNRIYEGAHVILVQSRTEANQVVTEAWEDLDDTGDINDAVDDALFAINVIRENQQARLVGRGVNSHYTRELPSASEVQGAFYRDFLLANLNRPDFRYQTPTARRAALQQLIQAHRASAAWRAQQRATRDYLRRIHRTPRYTKAVAAISPARRAWRSKRRVAIPLPPPPPRLKVRIPRNHPARRRGAPPPPPSLRPGANRPGAPGVKVGVPAPPPPPVKHGQPGIKVGIPVPGQPGIKVGIPVPGVKVGVPGHPPRPVKGAGAPPPPPAKVVTPPHPAKAPHPSKRPGHPSPPPAKRPAHPAAPHHSKRRGHSSHPAKAPHPSKRSAHPAPPPPPSKRR